MAHLAKVLEDAAVALAKQRMHAVAGAQHVLVALAKMPGVAELARVGDVGDGLLPPVGTSFDVPVLDPDVEPFVRKCTTPDAAAEVLKELHESLRDGGGLPNPTNTAGAVEDQVDVTDESAETDGEDATELQAGGPGPVRPAAPARSQAELLEEVEAELDSLVGLENVKDQVRAVIDQHRLNMERERRGLAKVPLGLNLALTGNPGTGKTTVARIIARYYQALGLLPRGHLVETHRADLVAGYVGQTALKVERAVKSARGGVLFIDEAYALSAAGGNDYGQEAIATLVKMMEDQRSDLAVFAAGYENEMAFFMDSNPGLKSRFAMRISFKDYTPSELLDIFVGMATEYQLEVGDDVREILLDRFDGAPDEFRRGNARSIRNLFNEMYARMAVRVHEDGVVTDDELEGFVVEDVPPMEERQIRLRPGFHT